jgi:hypothetical protein
MTTTAQRVARMVGIAAVLLVAGLAAGGGVEAQDKMTFAEAQKVNAQALRQYLWQSRTEIKVKGESKKVKLEQVRYDVDGKLQKTPLGGTSDAAPAQQPSGGRRGGRLKERVVENKKEEFGKEMQDLGALVTSYAHMPPDKTQAFAKSATVTKGSGDTAGLIQLQGTNVMQPGDAVTIWADPASQAMRRVEIQTALEKNPVTMQATFGPVQTGGPTGLLKAVLTYPERKIELTVENFGHQRVAK